MTDQAVGCHHCQRPVRPTMHGRHGASVDYYRMVTGPGKVETHEDPRTGSSTRVLRVEHLDELVTCRDCWERASVQAILRQVRSTGVVPDR